MNWAVWQFSSRKTIFSHKCHFPLQLLGSPKITEKFLFNYFLSKNLALPWQTHEKLVSGVTLEKARLSSSLPVPQHIHEKSTLFIPSLPKSWICHDSSEVSWQSSFHCKLLLKDLPLQRFSLSLGCWTYTPGIFFLNPDWMESKQRQPSVTSTQTVPKLLLP